jgi:hypothetical protein
MNSRRLYLAGALAATAVLSAGCPAGRPPVPPAATSTPVAATPVAPADAPQGRVGFSVEGSSYTREVEVHAANGEVVERRLMAPGEEVWVLLPAGEYLANVHVVPVDRLPAGTPRPACPEGRGTPFLVDEFGYEWRFVVNEQGEVKAHGETEMVELFAVRVVRGEGPAYKCAAGLVALEAPTSTPAFWPTGVPKPTAGPTAVGMRVPDNEAACLQQGGDWTTPPCMQLSPASSQCWNLPASDAGRPCSDSSECQGRCLANLTLEAASDLLVKQPEGQPPFMTGTCSSIVGPLEVGEPSTVRDGQLNPGHWVGCE